MDQANSEEKPVCHALNSCQICCFLAELTASFKDKAKPRQRAEETLQEEKGLNLDEKKKDYDPDFEELDREEEEKTSHWNSKKIAIFAGAGALAAVLLIAGCVKGCGGIKGKAPDSMQTVFEQYLEEDGNAFDAMDSLSEADQQKALSTAISTLEKLIGDGSGEYDRDAVVAELEKVLNDFNLGLPADTVHAIAEKMVELYTSSYDAVYTDVEKTNTSVKHLGDTVTNQMKENLYTITDYLTQLDGEIVNNQETLDHVINSNEEISASVSILQEKTDAIQNQISSSLTEIQNGFTQVDGLLEQALTGLDAYYAKYEQDMASVSTGITDIRQDIADTKSQIGSTQQVITDLLNEIETKNVTRQEELNQKLSQVSASIEDTREQMKQMEETVVEAISNLKEEVQDNQKELVELLANLESTMQEMLDGQMASIDAHFSTMQQFLEESFAALRENLDFSVLELKNQMDGIHAQIETTQSAITDILSSMDEKRDLQYQDIMSTIQTAVNSINVQMQDAYKSLDSLILQLKADGKADHAETLETLQKMESNFSVSMGNSLEQINNSFGSLNNSLAQYFEELKTEQGASQEEIGNAIGELGNNIRENQQVILDGLSSHDSANRQGQQEIKDAIKNHDANMVAGQEGLNSAIGSHNETVRGYIDGLKSYLSEKLDQVFTYVSNGKKLLASALLTKGVTIREDATFSELADAIIRVSQTIQVGELPGTIEYDYHYHLDADGNKVGQVETNDRQGGCYTVPVYHTHGDSCYNWSHEHTDHCKSHPVWVDWVPGDPYWGKIYDCGDQPANVKGSLKCTLPTSEDGQPIYYELGCGLLDGQIVSAHIVYDKDGVSAATKSRTILPSAKPIVAKGVVNESEYPEPVEPKNDVETETGQEEEFEVQEPGGEIQEPEHQSGKDQLEESQVEETVALPEQSESDETEDEGMPGEAAGKETEETGEAASEPEDPFQEKAEMESETAETVEDADPMMSPEESSAEELTADNKETNRGQKGLEVMENQRGSEVE